MIDPDIQLLNMLAAESSNGLSPETAVETLRVLADLGLGVTAGASTVHIDLSDPAVMDDEGRMPDAMYRTLLERLPVVTFLAKLGGAFNDIYVSPQIVDILGFTQQQWVDNPVLWYERLHDADKARWNVEFSRFLLSDEPFRSVYRFIARDGRTVWVRGEVVKIRDSEGRPIYIQGIGYDITELKESEEAVRRAHDELEERVIERTAALEARARELAEANAKLEFEMAERKRLEEQLLQARKMESIGTLAGGVAHDFNNLLTAILGFSELAQMRLPADDPSQGDIEQVRKAAERAAALVRHLLAFARKQMILPRMVSLNELALNLHPMLRRLIGADVDLTTLAEAPRDRVRVDVNQLEQVIVNLVVNARDAMPDGGRVLIETSNATVDEEQARREMELTPGEYAVLEVRDDGSGMSVDLQSRIFEPFFTTKELGKGTGLGLSTCYGIVKQSGGHIRVESALGHGTTFYVYLPLEPAPEPAPFRPATNNVSWG